MSGKRDSNSRPSAWEANALPTELLPHYRCKNNQFSYNSSRNRKKLFTFAPTIDRDVAQLASAPRSGRGGRVFESPHPDIKKAECQPFFIPLSADSGNSAKLARTVEKHACLFA